jgi:hypothetical protein
MGTWRGSSFTGDSETHVTEGFGNGASHSSQKICEGKLKEELLY